MMIHAPASLMRVTALGTAGENHEELIARGALFELVGTVLEMPPAEQRGLLLRVASSDNTDEYDIDAIRELAARPEFTDLYGGAGREDGSGTSGRHEVTA
jgi:hypothetical protein